MIMPQILIKHKFTLLLLVISISTIFVFALNLNIYINKQILLNETNNKILAIQSSTLFKKYSRQDLTVYDNGYYLQKINELVEKNSLKNIYSENEKKLRLRLEGKYLNFLTFLNDFAQAKLPLILSEFNINRQNEEIIIELTLLDKGDFYNNDEKN